MSKYKLINKTTGEEHICERVVIGNFVVNYATYIHGKKIIATNNPDIDLPKVVYEAERLAKETTKKYINEREKQTAFLEYIEGYNKSQETHPNSDEDIIDFNNWQSKLLFSENADWLIEKSTKELLQLWKEQKIKTLYYE